MSDSTERPQRQVGDTIAYSSGGTVHVSRITEVKEYGHVKVEDSPFTIPPAWILDDED